MSVLRSLIICATSCVLASPCRASDPSDVVPRLASAELRAHDARIATLRSELTQLPPEPGDQSTERIGWHSRLSRGANAAPKSITIDLGAVMDFDAVVLVPANVPSPTSAGPGYGFPLRFRVESLDEDRATLPVTLADHTSADFPSPGNLPVVLETHGARGRFIRVTATRLFVRDGFALFALGEVMVLRGQLDLAAGATVQVSDDYGNAPVWQPENATDSQSVLGPPIRVATTPGYGYHSTVAKSEAGIKWVQLDLGTPRAIDEVRLYAARPKDFPPRRGFGFPVRFRVEAAGDGDFTNPIILADWSDRDFPNPGENPVIIPARGATARTVRVTATRLWERDRDFIFALGEMEVLAGGENVASAAKVTALDDLEVGGWSAAYLNDGFTSQGRLENLADWLRGLSRRREVLHELATTEAERPQLVASAWRRIGLTAGAAAVISSVAIGLLVARRRQRHRLELARVRQQIAADLHDEIGSNLGSIALLARLAADEQPVDSRSDLAEIQRIAQESAESMRDIVWLIQSGHRGATDLVSRLREVAAGLLAEVEWTFEADGVEGPFSLEFERQLFLLYKEALNNIRKHAHAQHVTIRAVQQAGELVLTIADDGRGFDPETAATGNGLTTMRHRADLLGGTLVLQSSPTAGTQLELRTRLT